MGASKAPDARRLLVIDDDDDLRALVVRVVEQAGYAVDSASDGQAGLERLAAQTYDVIVCDVRMPRRWRPDSCGNSERLFRPPLPMPCKRRTTIVDLCHSG